MCIVVLLFVELTHSSLNTISYQTTTKHDWPTVIFISCELVDCAIFNFLCEFLPSGNYLGKTKSQGKNVLSLINCSDKKKVKIEMYSGVS